MQKLDPKAVWLFFIKALWQAIIWILIVFAIYIYMFLRNSLDSLSRELGGGSTSNIESIFTYGLMKWMLIFIPLFLIFAWVWAKLSYRFYRYELREDGFRKELGVIWKKYVTIPYDRIQNVDIYRGIIARLLGLSDLHIQTAGTAGVVQRNSVGVLRDPEGRLPGLSREVAEQLRDELIKRARQSKNQGL